jgi:hypothetical protein
MYRRTILYLTIKGKIQKVISIVVHLPKRLSNFQYSFKNFQSCCAGASSLLLVVVSALTCGTLVTTDTISDATRVMIKNLSNSFIKSILNLSLL